MDKLDTIKKGVFPHDKKRNNYMLKLFVDGEEVWNIRTHAKRRVLHNLRTIKNVTRPFLATLRVNYGLKKDHTGKMSVFCNEGIYDNYDDLVWAFEAFSENE